MKTTTGGAGGRPMVMGVREVVSSGHHLATQIGMDILARGGNAMDAGAGVGFALAVVAPQQNGIGGEAPMLVYVAEEKKVWAVNGHGGAPKEATLERFAGMGLSVIPGDGMLGMTTPCAPASWIAALERFGTMRLGEVLAPAVELAENGFPMYDHLHKMIAGNAERFKKEWPTSAGTWLVDGEPPAVGTIFRNKDWAETFKALIEAESRQRNRRTGFQAAHDEFYKGEIAKRMVEFARGTEIVDASGQAHAGLLTMQDLAGYRAKFEEAPSTEYRGLTVHKCGPWTQGPVLLQMLNLLEGYDLAKMGHNSAEYIHVVVEAMKLALADREFYYGDPEFVDVPMERLMSKEYAAERRKLIGERASMELRPGGRETLRVEGITDIDRAFAEAAKGGTNGDTTKLEVIDRDGNMVSATPSGGWLMSSPVVEGMGFSLGTRGQMFSLAAGHPNCIAPGKRPRTTLTPGLVTREGRPVMSFGSPGGDMQDQWGLEFLLNVVDFGMGLQEAVEAPTFWTDHAPSSFYPRKATPGLVRVEGRIGEEVRKGLEARGHVVHVEGDWAGGNTFAAGIDEGTGVRMGAASPRQEPGYAEAR